MENPWRSDPRLQGRFHPECPDDLQVVIHDGDPRRVGVQPEIVWVRIDGASDDRYTGTVLNAPTNLKSVRQGDEIRFIHANDILLAVSERYLAERAGWQIHPCKKCGLDEVFDPPSVLHRAKFPQAPQDGTVEAFTSLCPRCGGVQLLQNLRLPSESYEPPPKKWWQFWRS